MSCETFTTEINGHSYTYTQLPASKSLKLKFALLGVIGEGFSEIVANVNEDDEKQIEAIGKAMSAIFSKHDPDEVYGLIQRVLVPVFRDGQRVEIDRDFTGNIMEMYQVIAWVLQKEYSDFFEGAAQLLGQKKPAQNNEPKVQLQI